jgi:hypothetical protein
MDQNNNLPDGSELAIEQIDAAEPTDIQSTEKKPRLPIICIVIYAIAALCALLYVAFLLSPEFSDFFNKNISPFIRMPLAMLTGWIPFSLAELLLLFSPFAVIALVTLGIKKYSSSWRHVAVYCLTIVSLAAYVFSTFTLGFVPAYRGSTLDKKMGLDKQPVSADELYDTAAIVVEELNKLQSKISYSESSDFSVMPYGYDELNRKLLDAYEKASEEYDFIKTFDSRVKRVMLSEPMTYTHISGVYTFFTGEANLNTNFPDYTLPFTAAHELAHQRGFAREDEANFIAFLVCISSDDAYIRYSGYLNLYEYVASSLYSADPELYFEARGQLPMTVRYEMSAYSKFFDKYRDSVAGEVSGTINDLYLKGNGTEGTRSYGLVVDLAVAYDKKQHP